jgi:uncharacterized protein (DUF1810 family)
MIDLERFIEAQDAGGQYDIAMQEMKAGRKRGHWIWYVFPQIAGLGMSSMSRLYAIRDAAEAEAYLRDATLLTRLSAITTLAAEQLKRGVPIETLMGSPIDAAKLVSSMTLFSEIAARLPEADRDQRMNALSSAAATILDAAEKQGYRRCAHTMGVLRG